MDDTSLDNMSWLTRWYATECNGDWEHQSGIRITTIDNPGWNVNINLYGTLLDPPCPFQRRRTQRRSHAEMAHVPGGRL